MLNASLIEYAARIRELRRVHPDISEPALAPEFQRLLVSCLSVLPVPNQTIVPEFENPGVGRPDIAFKRMGQPARAFIELKHPEKAADPSRWTGHDRRQRDRFRTLRCWAASNFAELRLFERDNELMIATVVPKAALSPTTSDASAEQLIASSNSQPFAALLSRLANAQAPGATNAEELAANLAFAARLVRDIVTDRLAELKAEGVINHPLQQVRTEFLDVLYAHPEAGGYTGSEDQLFAPAMAQTLAFGLLLVREATGQAVDVHAAVHMPAEHPLLQTALGILTLPQIVQDIGIGFEIILDTVNSFAAELLTPLPGGRDPILYFYEDFLAVFDSAARERYGVYFTPVEVVRYMVGALDRALREDLNTEGLRDHGVTVLDPAAGTGTFLLGVADRVRRQAIAAAGPGMAHPELLQLAHRMFGFELLVGPYAVAHYRLHHTLRPPMEPNQPLPPPLPRLGVYLSDTLAQPGADAPQGPLGFVAGGIREERLEANRIKAEQPILAIIGNPPYRRLETGENERLVGRWMDEVWDDLKRPVREAGWGGELNTFPELSVAFWRWAMWKLFEAEHAPGRGVVAFITNRKFLTGHPYAGLREMMRRRFDRIEIIDLRGDVRRGERAGIGSDQGVFNIQVGTAITLAIADGSRGAAPADIYYVDSWAAGLLTRRSKLDWLDARAETGEAPEGVAVSRGTLDDMRPEPFENGAFIDIKSCFIFCGLGIQTKRDTFAYAFSNGALVSRIEKFRNSSLDVAKSVFHETTACLTYKAQALPVTPAWVTATMYRPLDRRVLYNNQRFIDRRRPDLQAAWGQGNVALYALPSGTGGGPALWVHALLPDYHSFRGSYGGYAFPLFDRRSAGDQINLSPDLIVGLATAYGTEISPQDVFDAMLALLSATSYTTRFAEDLEDVFPHVPFPSDYQIFLEAADVGREIREIETFARSPSPTFLPPQFARVETAPSNGALSRAEWQDGEICLRSDGSGKITGIPLAVWNFEISGYRVLPRWISAREGEVVNAALITTLRDVAGRVFELIHRFDEADLVLVRALANTLSRDELGFAVASDEPASGDVNE